MKVGNNERCVGEKSWKIWKKVKNGWTDERQKEIDKRIAPKCGKYKGWDKRGKKNSLRGRLDARFVRKWNKAAVRKFIFLKQFVRYLCKFCQIFGQLFLGCGSEIENLNQQSHFGDNVADFPQEGKLLARKLIITTAFSIYLRLLGQNFGR